MIGEPEIIVPPNIADEKVRRANKEYQRLTREHYESGQQLDALEEQRQAAVEADRLAYAGALRAGKSDPGESAVKAADAQIAEVRRRSEALELAARDAGRDLEATILERRPELIAKFTDAETAARAGYQSAIEELAGARSAFLEAVGSRRWLEFFEPGRPRPWSPRSNHVRGLLGQNGDPYPWGPIEAALREDAAPPAPPPEPAPPPRPGQLRGVPVLGSRRASGDAA